MQRSNVNFYLHTFLLALFAIGVPLSAMHGQEAKAPLPFEPPKEVRVLPIFFVASDQKTPTSRDASLLMKHLEWSRNWYEKALDGRDTFEIARHTPVLYRAKHPLAYYANQPKGMRTVVEVEELFEHIGCTRFNCPYVFVLMVDRLSERPAGGRSLNGGINTGGGVVHMATPSLTQTPNFQSTLRHELGHAFGLVHADAYGYDMKTNASVMAYNSGHKTNGFSEGPTPARLIPEDLRALAMNDRVFPDLGFDPQQDIPSGYKIRPEPKYIPPMPANSHPAYAIDVTTSSGEANASKASNAVLTPIKPNRAKGIRPGDGYSAASMWHSDTIENGAVSLELTFPIEVTLTAIAIHSQHSGAYHEARAVRIDDLDGTGWTQITTAPIKSANAKILFEETTATKWRLYLKTGESKKLVLRGLRFFHNDTEIFPPMIPYTQPSRN